MGNRNFSVNHSCIRTASNKLILYINGNKPHKYILLNQNCIYAQLNLPVAAKGSLTALTPPGTGTRMMGKSEGKETAVGKLWPILLC